MSTDVTSCFKECASTIQAKKAKEIKQKQRPSIADEENRDSSDTTADQATLAKTSPAFKSVSSTARAIVKDLAGLEELLLLKRLDYLSFNSLTCRMTDQERQRFDEQCIKVVAQLGANIKTLESRARQVEAAESKQQGEHLRAVTQLLEAYLKKCADIMGSMRKLRFAHERKRQQVRRLAKLVEQSQLQRRAHQMDEWEDIKPSSLNSSLNDRTRASPLHSNENEMRKRREEPAQKAPRKVDGWDELETPQIEEKSHLDAPRKAQLMQENEQIYEKFRHVHAEIDHVEEQITEIQRLQETFATKIFDQEKEIEDLNETAVQITMNIRDGNDWIRQAISNSASRRVVILFCIIVMTFTLIFLDWYNP